MSVYEQTEGPISVDRGYRSALGSTGDDESRIVKRADKSPDSESLGRFGAEPWNLPGFGDEGPRCGVCYPDGVCEAGHVDWGRHQCGRRSCPSCWSLWAQEGSIRAAERIQAFRYTQPPDYRRQTAHAVVSAEPEDVRTAREFWNGCSKAAEIAEKKGFRGFSVIPHPWRLSDLGEELYGHIEPEHGKWVWIRWLLERSDHWRCLFEWSPHYHIVGLTTEGMEEGKDSDEWMYHFIRSLDGFGGMRDSESHRDVYGLYRYLLSHTGYPEGSTKQVVRWYGDLANSVFVDDASEDWQHQKPSDGVMSALRREIEEIAGHTVDDEEGGGGENEEEEGECGTEGCCEEIIPIWDIDFYLQQRDVPRAVADTMRVAMDWRLGRIKPPPGAQNPTTVEQAEEALELLL